MFDERKLAQLETDRSQWDTENVLEFEKERKKVFRSGAGIPIERCYTPLDLEKRGHDYSADLGLPGAFPYTRGINPIMYRGDRQRVSTSSGRATPKETNDLWKLLVANGSDFLYFVYDLPSQLGYDPDHPKSEGEVGRVGVSLASQADWEVALDGIDVGKVAVGQVYNAPALVGIANHLLIAEKQGVDWKDLRGECQNDILKDYIARGTFIFPPKHGLRLVADALSFCAKHVPKYIPIQVNTYQVAEKGADAALEAASGLAHAFAYLQYALNRGVDVDHIGPGITFLTTCEHTDFFEDVGKHRAMRKIYAEVMRNRFKAQKPESLMFRVYCHNGGTTMHRQQFLNNITRSALSALAMAFSGCQSSSVRPYDEEFGTPTNEALLNVLRMQQIVTHETGVTDTVDPLGGSYYVESLTRDLEQKIWDELEAIDKRGGVAECIESGYFQHRLADCAFKWQKAFESGEEPRVGVNCFVSETEDERPTKIYRADPRIEQERIAEVQSVRQRRDNRKVAKTLNELKATAALPDTEENNLMPAVLEAVRAYATVGEICDALREIWGEYVQPRIV